MTNEFKHPLKYYYISRKYSGIVLILYNLLYMLVITNVAVITLYFHYKITFTWLFIGGVFLLLDYTVAKICKIRWNSRLFIFFYSFISLWGLFYAISYNESYGLFFGPNFDDSLFFQKIANNEYDNSYFFFVFIMGIINKLLSCTKSPFIVDSLIINWGIASIVCTFAHYYACLVAERYCKFLPVFLGVSMNYAFLDTVVHLYRDSMMLLFFLLCLISAQRRSYYLAIAFALATGLIRGANGFIALLSIVLYLFFRKIGPTCTNKTHNVKRNMKTYILLAVALLLLTIVIGNKLIEYRTSFAVFNKTTQSESIFKYVQDREQQWRSTYTDSKFFRRGLESIVIKPLVTLSFPLTLPPLFGVEHIVINHTPSQNLRMLRVYSIVIWFSIITSVFILPRLLICGLGSIKLPQEKNIPVLLFAILLLLVSFISFQIRHRCAYIVLIPAIIGLGDTVRIKQKMITILQGILVLLIIYYNARYYL